jgi:ATP-dependent helicase/nuclease subunit A
VSEVKWTKEQLLAINEKNNNILVAAAAGSGKTAVLVERIINKVINDKIDIDKILIVTFTSAAASEMRERILDAIYKKIEEDPNNVKLQRQINLFRKVKYMYYSLILFRNNKKLFLRTRYFFKCKNC